MHKTCTNKNITCPVYLRHSFNSDTILLSTSFDSSKCVACERFESQLCLCSRIIAMCGDYYIGGRRFSSLSDLIGYYSYVSCLLKGEKLLSPVAPPEVMLPSPIAVAVLQEMSHSYITDESLKKYIYLL